MAVASDKPPSSPGLPTTAEESMTYYKSQYEQLELELAEFQASSRELEAELEKDVEASEKRERLLKEKVEGLGYEVDEWKAKYKQSKAEANAVQNTLQKEITTLRDSNRTLQLRLRDTEVANDDFERQARNTTSSLEDLESKYNIAIERAVMLEAEIQVGEQEREGLRIETQRLRDELSDLKIEAEITQGKLRHAEINKHRVSRSNPHPIATDRMTDGSVRNISPVTATSSPTVSTPPRPKSASTVSEAPTPPSPPLSEASLAASSTAVTPNQGSKAESTDADSNTTPRPSNYQPRIPRHARGPSIPVSSGVPVPSGRTTPSLAGRPSPIKRNPAVPSGLPSSGSLRQIRGLIGQMQRLEKRVHSARSKLPAPVHTPPRGSPRTGSALGNHPIPASVTVRSHKKRNTASNADSIISRGEESEPMPLSTHHVSRLSFGGPPAAADKSASSRPSSRASISSRTSTNPHGGSQRPPSRTSMSGARTPLGHYSAADGRRPRSSLGGSYSTYSGHGHSASVGGGDDKDDHRSTPTPRRSLMKGEHGPTGIPTPSGLPRRQSGGAALGTSALPKPFTARRTSSGVKPREGEGERPESRKRLSGVGETY